MKEISTLSNSEANVLISELRGESPCKDLTALLDSPFCSICSRKLPSVLVLADSYDWFIYRSGNVKNPIDLKVFFEKQVNPYQRRMLKYNICRNCFFVNKRPGYENQLTERQKKIRENKLNRTKRVLDNAANPDYVFHINDHQGLTTAQKRARKRQHDK